jgi:FkbM family methyltransferase
LRAKFIRRLASGVVYRFRQWLFRPNTIKLSVSGEVIDFFIGDMFGKEVYSAKHDFNEEFNWIKRYGIRENDVVVDCGANHGLSTVLFARWAGPRGEVHAFEPLSHNVSILERNLLINGIKNVVVHREALGAQNGEATISLHPNASIVTVAEGTPTERVPLARLDDFPLSKPIAFLKIDVEGFETEVLRGARRILGTAPRLDLEIHVFLFTDKVDRLREIFSLIPVERYAIDIQHEFEGSITRFDPVRDSPEALSTRYVIHLFCREATKRESLR